METHQAGASASTRLLRFSRAILPALATIFFGVSGTALAETVNLSASKDTTIYSESGALSNGAGSWFFAGETNDATLRRALVAFDIAASIPSGSTINSVTLTLYLSRTRTGNTSVALHRVTSAWGEAGSNANDREGMGAPAQAGDATWTHRLYPNTTWAVPGGDIGNPASATTTVGSQGAYYSWTSNQMKLDVQAWLGSPSSNQGWIVIGDEDELKVAKRFDSRENPDAATRPKLTVTFTPPASSGACCATDGSCSVVLHPGTSCTGSYQGSGVSCSPNPCPQPTGACCLPVAAATCVEVAEAECEESEGMFLAAPADCSSAQCPVVLEPFEDPLPRPQPATPASGVVGGAATYNLAIREFSQKLHEDLPATRVWGFGDGPAGGGYPGPTIEATSGVPITVHWINDLRDAGGALRTEHYLPVDHCPHGAHTAAARTVIHLHGGHVPAAVDGYPEATFLPGEQVTYEYPNAQPAGTLWYHDHALGITRLNVYMGMAGFYLVRDPGEAALGLPSGEYEIPLAIQDRSFHPDGSLLYPEMWQEHFFGDTILVNGKVWPYLEVKRGKYRFRMLNGSTSRTYTLTLSNGAPFRQIGTDGGLLPAPVTVNTITIAPGERADVVIDFAGFAAGTEIILTNSAPAPYPNGDPGQHAIIPNVLQFKVLAATGHTAALPGALRPVEPLDEGESVIERDLELRKGEEECSGTAWFINGLRWDDITEYPELGTVEVWRFINRSGVMHPMHMHLVFFQVLDRQSFTESGDDIVLVGNPVPPPPEEAGWKDTVQVGPNEVVRVIARFEDYKGKYPYHCHILEHEDHEMMRQFQTVSCGDGEVDEGEECDAGAASGTAGACCTASCALIPDCETTTTTTTTTLEPTTTTTLAEATCGDANGDGEITASDALLALRTAVMTSDCPLCVCDVNSSGAVLAGDALFILRAAVGQEVVLDCVGC